MYRYKADELSKKIGIVELAIGVDALNDHGENQHSGANKIENVMSTQGNPSKYRITKLKRDHPDVAEK